MKLCRIATDFREVENLRKLHTAEQDWESFAESSLLPAHSDDQWIYVVLGAEVLLALHGRFKSMGGAAPAEGA